MHNEPPDDHAPRGALDDLLVLDLTRVLAGPSCTMLLGDFGAQVVKVEQPGRGDETRQWGPPFTASGQSAYYLCANRNKQSITLNLKHEAGRQVLLDLARRADVLVENFRVGTLEGLGLGYQRLSQLNPRLIYCAITGYGQNGPYRERAGYDTVIQAQSGLMSITGPAEGEPYKVGVAIVDLLAGLHAAGAILAALHHRERSGKGQYIDLALFDAMLGSLANVASAYLISGQPPRRYGNAHATIVPYQPFLTADGWIMLAVGNDGQFAALCRVLGREEWISDQRFATNPARVAQREILVPLIAEILRGRPADEWLAALIAVGVPCGPVNDLPAALVDPQAQARNLVQTAQHPLDGSIPMVGPVAKMSATPPTIAAAPPLLGEHTEELLRELLGYSDEQLRALRSAGAI